MSLSIRISLILEKKVPGSSACETLEIPCAFILICACGTISDFCMLVFSPFGSLYCRFSL